MPGLSDELVRDAFAPLMEQGFSGPDWWLAGTDQMVTFRRDGVEVHLEVEDMGTNLPNALIRQPDGRVVYLTDSTEYPAFARRFLTWIPWHGRRSLKGEIQQEFDARVRRLAALAVAHVAEPA